MAMKPHCDRCDILINDKIQLMTTEDIEYRREIRWTFSIYRSVGAKSRDIADGETTMLCRKCVEFILLQWINSAQDYSTMYVPRNQAYGELKQREAPVAEAINTLGADENFL